MDSTAKPLPPPLRLLERPRRGLPAERAPQPAPRAAWWLRWLPAWR